MPQPPPPIDAVIIAAGRATRMGGVEKGLQCYRGRPLIEHLIERLEGQCNHLAINCRTEADGDYRPYGLALIHDRVEGLGPLGGILAALGAMQHDWLLAVPCDTPLLPTDLSARLWQGVSESGQRLACAHDGIRRQNGMLLLHRQLKESLTGYLDGGDRKVGLWLEQEGCVEVDFSDQPQAFVNLNTLHELQELEQQEGPA